MCLCMDVADCSAQATTTGAVTGLVYVNQVFSGCNVMKISIHADSANSFAPVVYVCSYVV